MRRVTSALSGTVVAAYLLAGAAHTAPAAGAQPEACDALSAEEVQGVQSSPVKARRPHEEKNRTLRFAQCFFEADDYQRSVSLTLISSLTQGGDHVQAFWNTTFRQPQEVKRPVANARPPRQKAPPRAIEELGDEAFWTGDQRAGSLYVLARNVVLRISVGGVKDEEERIARSTALAKAVLKRRW